MQVLHIDQCAREHPAQATVRLSAWTESFPLH